MKDIITVESSNIKEAFKKSFKSLYRAKADTSDPDLIKESTLILLIENEREEENSSIIVRNQGFKLEQNHKGLISDSEAIVKKVIEHYNEELFDAGRVEWLIDYLKKNPKSRRAIIDIWQDQVDSQLSKNSPCVIYFWFRLIKQSLTMHTHMRANDAFRKFMLNLEIFLALQKHISTKTGYRLGKYLHFVDSFHFYKFNQLEIDELYREINNCPN